MLFDLFFNNVDKQDKRYNEIFELGRTLGIEEGKRLAYSEKIKNTDSLSEEEYNKLIEFLVTNNIELCYDINRCGMEVRRRNYHKQ